MPDACGAPLGPDRKREPLRPCDLMGADVRVVARRGDVVEGTCLDAWTLRSGGIAVKVKPWDGSAPREITTLEPIVVLSRLRRAT